MPALPPELCALLDKALSTDPSERPADASEFRALFDEAIKSLPNSGTNPIHPVARDAEVFGLPPLSPLLSREHVGRVCESLAELLGQPVLMTAANRVYELTEGSPYFLTLLTQRLLEIPKTLNGPVVRVDVDKACNALLERRGGVLDEVVERMRDERFKAVLEQLAAGTLRDLSSYAAQDAVDLGVIREMPDGSVKFGNAIWRLLVVRQLQSSRVSTEKPSWVCPDGRLDAEKLLDAFLIFWRRQGDEVFAEYKYSKLTPLVLVRFLKNIVKNGGRIERESDMGRERLDLCIRQGGSALAMVVRARRDREMDPVVEGLAQVDELLARHGIEHGWLVILDFRKGLLPVSQRVGTSAATTPAGRQIVVVRV